MTVMTIESGTKIRVLLVDDHLVLREGLRALLENEPGIEVVGEASDGRSAIDLVLALHPDVVVMDIVMEGMNGVDATREILSRDPSVKVVALSYHADRQYVERMFRAGARGYLLKTSGHAALLDAVGTVHSGQAYLSQEIAGLASPELVAQVPTRRSRGSGDCPLGRREREVLQLLAEGQTSRRIALVLGITEKTVETHRRNIMRKTGLRSIAALTKYAVREGLTALET
jgi:two-component system response regulator NreC